MGVVSENIEDKTFEGTWSVDKYTTLHQQKLSLRWCKYKFYFGKSPMKHNRRHSFVTLCTEHFKDKSSTSLMKHLVLHPARTDPREVNETFIALVTIFPSHTQHIQMLRIGAVFAPCEPDYWG